MKIGVSAFAWNFGFDASQVEVLEGLRERGIEGFEVPVFDPEKVDTRTIRRAMEGAGLECTVCAILPSGVNPISVDKEIRRRSYEHLVRCVEVTAELGGTRMGGPVFAPIGYLPGRKRTVEEWRWAVDCFQKLGEVLDAHGVELGLEPVNRSETFFLTTAQEAAELVDAIGHARVGVLIDTFHANIEEKDVTAAVSAVGKRMKHVHISENDRGIPGSGHVDFAGIVAALKDSNYEGYLMIEGFGFDPRYTKDSLWRDEGTTPLDVALGGEMYLRGLLG